MFLKSNLLILSANLHNQNPPRMLSFHTHLKKTFIKRCANFEVA